MSMFSNPGSKLQFPPFPSRATLSNPPPVESLAIQQQIELLQAQQQQIQATHQQYVNMGMIPPQQMPPGATFNPLQQPMGSMGQQNAFHFPPNNMPQNPQMGAHMLPPQQMSHRRNQSALPNMAMGGPPPAPSSGASGQQYHDATASTSARGGRGGGPSGAGHTRRHSLALPEAKKAAELAQQKRTTSGFQFPIPGAGGATPGGAENESPVEDPQATTSATTTGMSSRGRGSAHGRSQSMAVGRGGSSSSGGGGASSAPRGGGHFHFPAQPGSDASQMHDAGRRTGAGSTHQHQRNSSRSLEGNWRNQGPPSTDQPPMGTFTQPPPSSQQGAFQPGHRSRASMNQSVNSLGNFAYPGQPQFVQLPQGGMAMVPPPFVGTQMAQLQAFQAAQMSGQMNLPGGPPGAGPGSQPQRKTLFTPYLPQATLPALLGDGQLVQGILRVNKKNRSDAYVTTQDGLLDADIFICGSKDRNRALEGDLVAIELLDVDEVWGQKREKEEKKKRKDLTDTRSGASMANSDRAHRDPSSTADDATAAAEGGGVRRRGSLRQRPTQKKNDDVEVEGQSLLLVEEEEVTDEQKPLYAGHVVAVVERVAGQMFSGTLGLLRPSSQATKEKQEAERQARDGHAGRHHEPRQQEKPKIVWFKPTDKRVPLIAIPTEQAPRDFVDKHQEYADRIFVACIKRWPITSLHPFGTLVEQLGKMGELKVETDALLRDNNFASDEFSDAVLRSVGLDDWSLAQEDAEALAGRRDFRAEQTFTIDPNGADELDDAIHIKHGSHGRLEIGVHIADVAHFIRAGSLVDREAKKRGTAVYLMNRSCHMLPPKISSDVCSLIPGQDRLTVSVVFQVSSTAGGVIDDETWVGKSIIKSSGKLSYREVDAVLAGSQDVSVNGVATKDIQILHAVAQKFREARLGSTSETIAPLRLLHQLDDENVPVEQNIFTSSPSHDLIEELLHRTNAHIAQTIARALPTKALLRRQGPPNHRRLHTFAERMTKLGYEIDTSSSGSLQNSLFKVDDAELRKGMETLLVKTMHRAKYCIMGKTPAHLLAHYALNQPLYTHFTNPSRRYADLVVHRQLEAVLAPGPDGVVEYAEEVDALVKTTESCNNKKDSAQNAQEQSVHIESCRIMDRKREEAGGELISEGIVICVYESAFDVLIPEFGFEKRVHCDQLPLHKAEFRKESRVLELYWEKGVASSAYVPEDERVKPNASQRASQAVAAAKQAAVAERAKKEHEEAQRKQMETGTMSTDDVDALFDDDDDDADDVANGLAGVSLADRSSQSVPPSPTKHGLANAKNLQRSRSESKVHAGEARRSTRERYMHLFSLREEQGEYIQDVREMTRVPVILKTDLTKSPP